MQAGNVIIYDQFSMLGKGFLQNIFKIFNYHFCPSSGRNFIPHANF